MNGAGVIAEILKREGTEFLSCYPRNPLIEACAAIDIRPVLCRQERVGVGIADGYSRIRRGKRNGVFAAQAGPGIENAFPGDRNTVLFSSNLFQPYRPWDPRQPVAVGAVSGVAILKKSCSDLSMTTAR